MAKLYYAPMEVDLFCLYNSKALYDSGCM